MAQTTAQVSSGCGKVEVSIDNSTWTDISGVTNKVDGLEQSRMSGEVYTLTGDTALIGGGKREPIEASVAIVYTETDAEGYQVIRQWFETTGCDNPFYLRYSPRGGAAGDEQITTSEGRLTSFIYPPLDAGSGDPIMCGFKAKFPGVTTTIVATS